MNLSFLRKPNPSVGSAAGASAPFLEQARQLAACREPLTEAVLDALLADLSAAYQRDVFRIASELKDARASLSRLRAQMHYYVVSQQD